jgi:peptide chain release factor 1
MYQRYAAAQGWKATLVSTTTAEAGGYKEVVVQVSGAGGVYSKLKWEAGVHRVQRVPATEAAGRVHTSTATVAIMPEVDEVDVTLDMRDVEVKFARCVWCWVLMLLMVNYLIAFWGGSSSVIKETHN